MRPVLLDSYGRRIEYLRVSITDSCNLNCFYCSPGGKCPRLPRAEILSFEEIFRVVEAAVSAGIRKVRLTGGEPLMRRNVVELCRMLSGIHGLESLALTTNGLLFEGLAESLFDAGLIRVNFSLDTLNHLRFKKITGHSGLARVLGAIRKAEETGFAPIKTNTVVMRGINLHEVPVLARLAAANPYHVRFIELMPSKTISRGAYRSLFVPAPEILDSLKQIGELVPVLRSAACGPARLFSYERGRGKVGLISAMTESFCDSCNRLRLTANGRIKTCLFSEQEVDLKGPLRDGAPVRELSGIFLEAVSEKPFGRPLFSAASHDNVLGEMRAVGG